MTFNFFVKKNKAVTLRSIVFKYPGFTACCWLSVGCGISGPNIRFMGFNSLYGYGWDIDAKLSSKQNIGGECKTYGVGYRVVPHFMSSIRVYHVNKLGIPLI